MRRKLHCTLFNIQSIQDPMLHKILRKETMLRFGRACTKSFQAQIRDKIERPLSLQLLSIQIIPDPILQTMRRKVDCTFLNIQGMIGRKMQCTFLNIKDIQDAMLHKILRKARILAFDRTCGSSHTDGIQGIKSRRPMNFPEQGCSCTLFCTQSIQSPIW
mmetsp:Transcript_147326/g.271798  ORF Transcript_147326/g.271798 Transcript_147326/m.271798 type:complete len:160 (-) Transcript_147326:100-579(-)